MNPKTLRDYIQQANINWPKDDSRWMHKPKSFKKSGGLVRTEAGYELQSETDEDHDLWELMCSMTELKWLLGEISKHPPADIDEMLDYSFRTIRFLFLYSKIEYDKVMNYYEKIDGVFNVDSYLN